MAYSLFSETGKLLGFFTNDDPSSSSSVISNFSFHTSTSIFFLFYKCTSMIICNFLEDALLHDTSSVLICYLSTLHIGHCKTVREE